MADSWGTSWGGSWGTSWGVAVTTVQDSWGDSWGDAWNDAWGHVGGPTPPVARDTGGSGHKGSGRRRNLNDDSDAFAELLKEWREKKDHTNEEPVSEARLPAHREDAATSLPQEEPTEAYHALLDELRQAEVSYDRAMAAYEAALVKLEQVRTAKAKRAAIVLEEQARRVAMQQAIEWELARLAYEDFLDDEDDVMLLTA